VKLIVSLALLACMFLFYGAVLWYVVFPFIPPQDGPLHGIVVLLVVLVGVGLGVLNRPCRSGVRQ
jgi:hypothetical protein